MFVGLFLHPKEVYKGFKEGLQCESLIDSKIPKKELLNSTVSELKNRLKKSKAVKFNWLSFKEKPSLPPTATPDSLISKSSVVCT